MRLRLLQFTNERSLVAGALALFAIFAFYVFVGITGGITDGFDRFSAEIEPLQARRGMEHVPVLHPCCDKHDQPLCGVLQETLANDPDYRPPLPDRSSFLGLP